MLIQRLHMLIFALLAGLAGAVSSTAQTITTLAGTGGQGYAGDGGVPTSAVLSLPAAVWGDTTGVLFIADTGNNAIRQLNASRSAITAFAGTGTSGFLGDGGAATAAKLSAPGGVFVDSNGVVYIADTGNNRIRKVLTTGVISTIAGKDSAGFSGDGGDATAAKLRSPTAVFARGGFVYIADTGNNRIRRIDASGKIATIAGKDTTAGLFIDDTKATSATLSRPSGLYVDRNHDVYIADTYHHRIRKLAASDSTMTTIVGNGSPGSTGDGDLPIHARLAFPSAVVVDTFGTIYLADRFNHRIRRVNPAGNITSIAGLGTSAFSGDGGAANRAELASPNGLFLRGDTLFVADQSNQRLRKIVPDHSAGLSGASKIGPGREAKLLSIALTGDGSTTVNGLTFTVSDLATATGLSTADFNEFRLYESGNATLGDDLLLGRLDAADVTLGTRATVVATTFSTPAAGTTRHYILSARLTRAATQGHALRVSAPTGALSTDNGGRGARIYARDADKLTVDAVATKLIFHTQPSGGFTGTVLSRQPLVEAVDDSGFVDYDFRDTLTVTSSGSGSLLQNTTIADSGRATFDNLSYSTAIDDESIVLSVHNVADPAHSALTAAQSNAISINVVNDRPTVDFPALVFREDEELGYRVLIRDIVSDVDDTTFTFAFKSSHITARTTADSLIVLPGANFFGIDTLTVTAIDAFGLQHSDSGIIEVKAVNDAPAVTLPVNLTWAEDETLRVDMKTQVSDIDNDFSSLQLSFVASDGLSQRYTSASGQLELWAAPNSHGSFSLDVLASDGLANSGTKTAAIHIQPRNDPPQIALRDTSILQGGQFVIDLAGATTDIDDPASALRWSAASDALTHIAIDDMGRATVRPTEAFSGVRDLFFSVVDSSGASAVDTLRLTVLRVNQPPTLSALPDAQMAPGDTLFIDLAQYGSDPDDAPSSLIWSLGSTTTTQTQLNGSQLRLIAPAGAAAYAENISVRVYDLLGFSSQDTFAVRVASSITPLPDLSFSADSTLIVDLQAYIAPSVTTLSAVANAALNVAIDLEKKTLALSARDGFKGETELVLQASTERGAIAADTILVTSTNPAPVLSAFPELFVDAGASIQFDLDTYARDDEALALLHWTALPDAGLQISIHGTLHIATVSASSNARGPRRIAFTATDAQGASATDTLNITVHSPDGSTAVNSAPILSGFPPLFIDAGTGAQFALDTYAQDDQPLQFLRWSARADSGLYVTIDDSLRLITILADSASAGLLGVSLTATDAEGASTTDTLRVTVHERAANSNRAPVLDGLPPLFIDAGTGTQLTLNNYVQDDQPLRFLRWSARADSGLHVAIDDSLHIATITADSAGTGALRVFFTATDGDGASATDTLYITVHGLGADGGPLFTNRAPTLAAIPSQQFNSDAKIYLSLNRYAADDAPREQLVWNARTTPGEFLSIEIDSLGAVAISAAQVGRAQVVFTATDAGGLSASTQVEFVVLPPLSEKPTGDFNDNWRVDYEDFFQLIDAMGLTPLHPDWDPTLDLDFDGRISIDDFFIFADSFNTHNAGR